MFSLTPVCFLLELLIRISAVLKDRCQQGRVFFLKNVLTVVPNSDTLSYHKIPATYEIMTHNDKTSHNMHSKVVDESYMLYVKFMSICLVCLTLFFLFSKQIFWASSRAHSRRGAISMIFYFWLPNSSLKWLASLSFFVWILRAKYMFHTF